MNRRATIVLLLVAVLLAGFLVLTRSGTLTIGGGEESEDEGLPSFDPLFAEAEGDEVVAFSISDEQSGDRLAAELGDEGWTLSEAPVEPDQGQVVDSNRLDTAARSLSTLVTSRQLSEIESLAQYGLESAHYTLDFSTQGGGQFTLYIGDTTPGEASYYTQRPGDQDVSLVSAAVLGTFVEFLAQPPYAEPTATPEPTPESVPLLTPAPTP